MLLQSIEQLGGLKQWLVLRYQKLWASAYKARCPEIVDCWMWTLTMVAVDVCPLT